MKNKEEKKLDFSEVTEAEASKVIGGDVIVKICSVYGSADRCPTQYVVPSGPAIGDTMICCMHSVANVN